MAYLPLRSVTLPADVSRRYDAWLEQLQDRLARPGRRLVPHRPRRAVRDLVSRRRRLRRAGGRPGDARVQPARAAVARPAQHHARARVLRRRRSASASPGSSRCCGSGTASTALPLGRAERAPGRGAPPGPGARIFRPLRPQLQSASSSSSSPTGTTWRWATTSWCTATCCWTIGAASPWATGSASPTTPTSTATPTASWSRRKSPTPAPCWRTTCASPITPRCSPACGWAATAWSGASAVATKDVRPYHVNVGIPAKSIRIKPNAPPEAYVTERVAKRES